MLLVARCSPLLRFTNLFVLCLTGGVLSCLGHAARHTARLQRCCAVVCAVVRSCGLFLGRPWPCTMPRFSIHTAGRVYNISLIPQLNSPVMLNALVIRRTVRRKNSGFRYSPDENYVECGWVHASSYTLACTFSVLLLHPKFQTSPMFCSWVPLRSLARRAVSGPCFTWL